MKPHTVVQVLEAFGPTLIVFDRRGMKPDDVEQHLVGVAAIAAHAGYIRGHAGPVKAHHCKYFVHARQQSAESGRIPGTRYLGKVFLFGPGEPGQHSRRKNTVGLAAYAYGRQQAAPGHEALVEPAHPLNVVIIEKRVQHRFKAVA